MKVFTAKQLKAQEIFSKKIKHASKLAKEGKMTFAEAKKEVFAKQVMKVKKEKKVLKVKKVKLL